MIASEKRKMPIVGVSSTGDTMLVRTAEGVYADLEVILGAPRHAR